MRTSLVEAFQSTMNECFLRTLHDMLGSSVTGEVCRLLEKSGVPPRDIALRFDEVVEILTRAFGSSARVLVYKAVVLLYEEYSLRPGFGFYDSLRDKVSLLKEKVISDLLKPRHSPSVDDSIYIATR